MRASLFASAVAALALPAAAGWKQAAPLPVPRTEVAAALLAGREIVVVGGFVESGANVSRADAYSPAKNRWRRLPDLPETVDHAMAASYRGRVYVIGGYGSDRRASSSAFVFRGGAWKALPRMPEGRAAAGAAVVGSKLYVVGGIGSAGAVSRALRLDLRTLRWSFVPGPSLREHLAVTALRGKIYALAGRTVTAGNFDTFEAYTPALRRWRRLPPIPDTRGGTGAAAVGNTIVSVGGEEPGGTIESVYGYNVKTRRWSRLPDLPTPRHGLGVVAYRGRVYAIAGGPQPGLYVSGANEYLPRRKN
jgi:N-acetylneuraminic acid mutarotase